MNEGYFALFMRTGDPRLYLLAKCGAPQEGAPCKKQAL